MRSIRRSSSRLAASALTVATALAFVGLQASSQASAATPTTTRPAAALADCTPANTKLTVTKVSRPINHLLLTATNTSGKPCNAFGAPLLRLGSDAQSVTQMLEDSKPQAVVTIAPGESAYAGIGTYSPDGEGGYTADRLGVQLTDKGGAPAGEEKTLELPNGGVYVNSAAFVTYWQFDAASALFY